MVAVEASASASNSSSYYSSSSYSYSSESLSFETESNAGGTTTTSGVAPSSTASSEGQLNADGASKLTNSPDFEQGQEEGFVHPDLAHARRMPAGNNVSSEVNAINETAPAPIQNANMMMNLNDSTWLYNWLNASNVTDLFHDENGSNSTSANMTTLPSTQQESGSVLSDVENMVNSVGNDLKHIFHNR